MKNIIKENFWSVLLSLLAVALCVAVFAQMLGEHFI